MTDEMRRGIGCGTDGSQGWEMEQAVKWDCMVDRTGAGSEVAFVNLEQSGFRLHRT